MCAGCLLSVRCFTCRVSRGLLADQAPGPKSRMPPATVDVLAEGWSPSQPPVQFAVRNGHGLPQQLFNHRGEGFVKDVFRLLLGRGGCTT